MYFNLCVQACYIVCFGKNSFITIIIIIVVVVVVIVVAVVIVTIAFVVIAELLFDN